MTLSMMGIILVSVSLLRLADIWWPAQPLPAVCYWISLTIGMLAIVCTSPA